VGGIYFHPPSLFECSENSISKQLKDSENSEIEFSENYFPGFYFFGKNFLLIKT